MPGPQTGKYMLATLAMFTLALLIIPAIGALRKAEGGSPANELRYVQSAVTIMMTHNNITTVPHPITEPTNDMSQFPDATTSPTLKGLWEDDRPGYVLYQHDNKADGIPEGTVDYLRFSTTNWFYTVAADGSVIQWREPSTKDK